MSQALRVVRHRYGSATIGAMFVDGLFYCYTLEDAVTLVRNDAGVVVGHKINGATAIPAGVYNLAVTRSHRFKKDLVEVLDVPRFTGIRIHGGNTADDTEGCILTAETAAPRYIAGRAIELSAQLTRIVKAGSTIEVVDNPADRMAILDELERV